MRERERDRLVKTEKKNQEREEFLMEWIET